MNERGSGFQPIDKQNVKELRGLSRDIAKERIRKMEERGSGREEIESIAKEAQKIEEEIGKSADILVKDDTFLGWVRKTFKEAVLIVAVLKTMASMSGSGHEAEPQVKSPVAAETQEGDVDDSGIDSANNYHSGSDFIDSTDTYYDNIDRPYSPDYHVGEGQLDLSNETQQVNKMIQSFCEQRGIQPWEVGASVHLVSHASIEGDANSNYNLAGEGLSVAEESLGKSLADLGINADNLKITSENIGEAAYVDGKILNEPEARTAMMDLLGVNSAKLDQKIHAFNHGGKLSDAEKKVLGDYLDRGIEVKVVLEDLSDHTSTGFTKHVSEGYTPHIPTDSGHDTVPYSEPFMPVKIATPEDRQQTTEEIYIQKKKKRKTGSSFPFPPPHRERLSVVENDEDDKNPEDNRNKIKPEKDDERGEKPFVFPDKVKPVVEFSVIEDDVIYKQEGEEDYSEDPIKPVVDETESSKSPTETKDSEKESAAVSPFEPAPRLRKDYKPEIIDELDDVVISGNMQQNPNVQGTRRQGSEGGVFKKGNNRETEEWDRVVNKGDRLKTQKEMVKLGRKDSEKARSLDRKAGRNFAESIGKSDSYEE